MLEVVEPLDDFTESDFPTLRTIEDTRPSDGDRSRALEARDLAVQARNILIVASAVVGLAAAGMILAGNIGVRFSLAYFVFLFGCVGGIANNYRRLQHLAAPGSRGRISAEGTRLVTYQVYLSPLVGGVFALVLYGLFMAGILTGALFPDFTCTGEAYAEYEQFAMCSPATVSAVAKAFVWAFAAGFLEGLVPNFISALKGGSSG